MAGEGGLPVRRPDQSYDYPPLPVIAGTRIGGPFRATIATIGTLTVSTLNATIATITTLVSTTFSAVTATISGKLTLGSTTWLTPSGDTTGAADTTAINNALTTYQYVRLLPGVFYTNAPILIPPGTTLEGSYSNEVSTYLTGYFGSVIKGVAAWSNGVLPWTGVISVVGQTEITPNYATQNTDAKFRGIYVDCHLIAQAGVDGVCLYGDVHRPFLEHAEVSHCTGNGLNMVQGAVSGLFPNAPRGVRFNVRNATLTGFIFNKVSDGSFIDCLAEDCLVDGWDIQNGQNGTLVACRAEHNGTSGVGDGYKITITNSSTGSGGLKLIGCSTDRNEGYGVEITSTNVSGLPVTLAGCQIRRDGRNGNLGGGSLAGLYIHANPGWVNVTGTTIWPGLDDDGSGVNSPQIGVLLASNTVSKTMVSFSSCHIQGATTSVSDDNSEAAVYYNGCTQATGTTSTPTLTFVQKSIAALSAASVMVLQNLTANPSQPILQITNASSADRAIALNVAADSHQRWQIDSNGKMQWGPGGSSFVDTDFYRASAHNLQTDDNLTVTGSTTSGSVTSPTITVGTGEVLTEDNGRLKASSLHFMAGTVQVGQLADEGTNTVTLTVFQNLFSGVIPANDAVTGATYKLKVYGYGTWGTVADTLTFAARFGAAATNTVGTTPAIDSTAFSTTADVQWEATVTASCVTNGVSATWNVIVQGTISQTDNNLIPGTAADDTVSFIGGTGATAITLDSTVSESLGLSAKWSSSAHSSTITKTTGWLERVA